jgi:hypothetical protein
VGLEALEIIRIPSDSQVVHRPRFVCSRLKCWCICACSPRLGDAETLKSVRYMIVAANSSFQLLQSFGQYVQVCPRALSTAPQATSCRSATSRTFGGLHLALESTCHARYDASPPEYCPAAPPPRPPSPGGREKERLGKCERTYAALCDIEDALHDGLLGVGPRSRSLEVHFQELAQAIENVSSKMMSCFGRR